MKPCPLFIKEFEKDPDRGSIRNFGTYDQSTAQSSSLGRPRPGKGAPNHSARGPQADSRAPQKNVRTLLLSESDRSHLQLNDISVSTLVPEGAYQNSS
jgi:hypothetical protein